RTMSFARAVAAVAAVLAVVAALALNTPNASAHERRTVADTYTVVVGFINEPVFLEEPNGIDLRVTDAQTNEPVLGVEKTLKADVTAGGQTKTVDLKTRFGQPGAYTADIIPTSSGTWAFRFHGTIDGTPIDERFESGPGRFNEPQSKSEIQFPVQQPTVAELVQQVQQAGQAPEAAQAITTAEDVKDAEDRANMGVAFGVAGSLIGLVGIGLAAVAMSRSRRPGSGTSGGSTAGHAEPV
ncbi:MAG: hypothetical protein ACRDJE_18755, partial [Dehalococcoidia bacterium]